MGRDLHFTESLSDSLPVRYWHVRRLLHLLVSTYSPAVLNPVPTPQACKMASLRRPSVVLMETNLILTGKVIYCSRQKAGGNVNKPLRLSEADCALQWNPCSQTPDTFQGTIETQAHSISPEIRTPHCRPLVSTTEGEGPTHWLSMP